MNRKAVTYISARSTRQGYFPMLCDMVRDVIESRWLTYQLFRRNFSALYRQSVLGLFWALVVPLVSVATFIYLNVSGIMDVGDLTIPYPLYAVAGVALWQIFATGLTLGANSLVSAGLMLTKVNFTRESLVFSAVAQGAVPSLIQLGVVLILFAYYQIVPPLTIFLLPFAIIPLLLLTLGLGFILSLINGVLRDVSYAISFVATFLMFLTPVLYAKPPSGIAATVNLYNPLYYLVSVPRDLLVIGSTNDLTGYLYSALFSLVVFFVCWIAFHLAEGRVIERI